MTKNDLQNGANAQVNAGNTASVQSIKSVADNKAQLAGEQEKVFKTLVKGLRSLYRSRTTITGRLIDLASVAGEHANIVKSGDFKGAVKLNCDHLTLVQTDKAGKVLSTFILPVKFVPLASRENYNDYKIEDLVVTIMGRKSASGWALAGYSHDGKSVDTGIFAELRHEYTHEVTRTQSAVAADGTTVTVPVYEVVETDGGTKKVAVKDAITETYVPVYCDTISPKRFEEAVEKAIESMWLKLFAK